MNSNGNQICELLNKAKDSWIIERHTHTHPGGETGYKLLSQYQ